MPCELCHTRREKRFCPAVQGRICPQCCGAEREVTLDCPSECVYLQQARQHERPRELAEMNDVELFPAVEISEGFVYEREPLLVGLSYALATRLRADREVRDRDLIAALTALASRYQTLVGSGLHVESASANPAHQVVIAELEHMLAEYRRTEEQHRGYSSLRDADVLRALVFLVRMAHTRTSGRPKARALADFLLAQFPEKPATQDQPRIVV